ncbi:Kinesin-like protein KIFC3 [Takifugu flavidus]|uniref:Kinesin-like protein KIFC3 n=1 Tax=Takifugu flavidus TaxID=433684 RepID=A0A5C6NK95_9TELE|nr:Kinesin-like protein KIFC3 [Takifugu flavidus]
MHVLCSLAVLALHSLFKSWTGGKPSRSPEAAAALGGGGARSKRRRRVQETARLVEEHMAAALTVWKTTPVLYRRSGSARVLCRRCEDYQITFIPTTLAAPRSEVCSPALVVQQVQRSSALLSPAVMYSTRKTWDLSHSPCLQELWKKDASLDASSVDLLSDGEDDASFLSLPTATYSQRPSLTAELSESNTPNQQLLIQVIKDGGQHTLQDKIFEFQAHLHSQEVSRRLLLQLQQQCSGVEKTSAGAEALQPSPSGAFFFQALNNLYLQVEELEKKVSNQTQEVERLRSQLGATDLEKQLELLLVENQRLKKELKSCKSTDAAAESCSHCSHSQEVETLRREMFHWERQARQREQQLAELEKEVVEKSSSLESLHRQLHGTTQQLEETRKRQAELKLTEGELSRHLVTPPRAKCVTHMVEEEEPADAGRAVAELQKKNEDLLEQLHTQKQLQKDLQTQLHESQRICAQLRTQILVYEGEMARAQGHLEAEMQNLEEEKNRVIEEAFIRAESEMKAVHENLAGVRLNLLSLQPALRTLTLDYNLLKRQVQDFPFMLDQAITQAKQEICQVISEVSSTNQELLRKYKREMNLRKKCHNELVRLRGNIRVFCRVRPISQEEQDSVDARTMLSFDSDDDAVLYLSNKGRVMKFELDKVFPPPASQEEVFQEVQSLVTSCIDGFNVCIFAYGQTGSGKTYTMEGIEDNPGINQRALRLLFSEVLEKAPDWDYTITVSMVEIYNESLRNLLGDSLSDRLDIKMNPDGSGQLYVPGLTEFTVQSPEDINRVFELGHMNRATACTNLNEHSSRSHALLIITVSGYNTVTGSRTQGKLNLVDLAGSERIAKSGAEGNRLREAQCINKSLSALGDVINALRGKHSHVPFRNSRLTYLLQDSLSGDSKTLMMVQVSPLPANMSESISSLKFAQRVRSVELSSSSSSARRHENSSTSSSPTHDSVEFDSPPVTPVPLPISRASSAGSTLSSTSRTPSTSRRRSQSQLSTDRHVERGSPLVGDSGQVGEGVCWLVDSGMITLSMAHVHLCNHRAAPAAVHLQGGVRAARCHLPPE